MPGWRSRARAFRPRLLTCQDEQLQQCVASRAMVFGQVFATFGKVQKESDSLSLSCCSGRPGRASICERMSTTRSQGFFPAFRLRVGQLHSYLLASSKVARIAVLLFVYRLGAC